MISSICNDEPLAEPSSSNPFISSVSFRTARILDHQGEEANDVSSISFAPASAFPGFSSVSLRDDMALIPSAAALVKARNMMAAWDDELDKNVINTPDRSSTHISDMKTPFTGFSTASNKGFLVPSAASLASAERKRKLWEKDELDNNTGEAGSEDISFLDTPSRPRSTSRVPSGFVTPFKPPTKNQELSLTQPSTSTIVSPAALSNNKGFSTPMRDPRATIAARSFGIPSLASELGASPLKGKSRGFKSPLLPGTIAKLHNNNGNRLPSSQFTPSSSQSGLRLSQVPRSETALPSTPARPSCPTSIYATPPEHPGIGKLRPVKKLPFTTPFKPGMTPGNPRRMQLERQHGEVQVAANVRTGASSSLPKQSRQKENPSRNYRFFDLRE